MVKAYLSSMMAGTIKERFRETRRKAMASTTGAMGAPTLVSGMLANSTAMARLSNQTDVASKAYGRMASVFNGSSDKNLRLFFDSIFTFQLTLIK